MSRKKRTGMTRVYYNEHDRYVAQWLRNLIAAELIAPGDVDDRSILEVQPSDLTAYTQCHFFAGIAGWSYALRLAGWPDEREVWTGSCPCQPLSIAGRRKGDADERHLWPAFYSLIAERKPPVVFGEQVANNDGREWLAGVRADLESLGYACGAADLCAASVGAPHRRARLYWVGDSDPQRWQERNPKASPLGHRNSAEPDGHRNAWEPFESHKGDDGTLRRVGAGVQPVAYGFPHRVGRLGAYGNAIVPQVAAEFIHAYLDCEPSRWTSAATHPSRGSARDASVARARYDRSDPKLGRKTEEAVNAARFLETLFIGRV
ncbi:MAG: DNA cytosine methyltransferase [Candidatus Binataceae bacterium]